MMEPTLVDLVRNGTMSPGMAATLAVAASERRGLLMIAIPRLAGKTTTMNATLAYRPPGTPVHVLTESDGPGLGIPRDPDGSYLVVSEIAQTPFPHYLWGDPVRRVFAALRPGFSLATALHAGGVEEAFDVICGENGVPDEQAAAIDLAVYIRTLGSDWRHPTGRRLAVMQEVESVRDGRPLGRVLHRWDERADRFEELASPVVVGSQSSGIDERVREFADVT